VGLRLITTVTRLYARQRHAACICTDIGWTGSILQHSPCYPYTIGSRTSSIYVILYIRCPLSMFAASVYLTGTKSLITSQCGNGYTLISPFLGIGQIHANVFCPLIFIAQLPQIPSLHDLRNVSDESCVFLISMRASNIIGPGDWFRV